jgi:hypothetical protein
MFQTKLDNLRTGICIKFGKEIDQDGKTKESVFGEGKGRDFEAAPVVMCLLQHTPALVENRGYG